MADVEVSVEIRLLPAAFLIHDIVEMDAKTVVLRIRRSFLPHSLKNLKVEGV